MPYAGKTREKNGSQKGGLLDPGDIKDLLAKHALQVKL